MRIDAGSNYLYTSQRAQTNHSVTTGAASFAATLTAANANTEPSGAGGDIPTDFTQMTRQNMRDWLNAQIRSGKMSFDDSTPFVGMTMKVSVQGFQPVDSATDMTPINFIDKARAGIAGALSRNDREGAKQLQAALASMLKFQGQPRVDTRA